MNLNYVSTENSWLLYFLSAIKLVICCLCCCLGTLRSFAVDLNYFVSALGKLVLPLCFLFDSRIMRNGSYSFLEEGTCYWFA